MNPYLSIVIPTFNRVEKLKETLSRLEEQTLNPNAYEIWVVNDGSTDETESYLEEWAQKSPLFHTLTQKNAGQGAARNKALKHCHGEVVLIMGDDIFATKNFLQAHVQFHQDHPEKEWACLGLTTWQDEETVSPFMKWLTHGGPQFDFDSLHPNRETDFWHFYTSNISLKKSLLDQESFDECFKGYGWEDIELGYRFKKHFDLKLIYTPNAHATHDHLTEEKDLERKMKGIGKTAHTFQKLHPELQVIPKGIKRVALKILSSRPIILFLRLISRKKYWWALSKRYFLQGIDSL